MTAFLFDGHIRNITNLDYDIYITFTISAALELPADLGRVLDHAIAITPLQHFVTLPSPDSN